MVKLLIPSASDVCVLMVTELSIAPHLNQKLVPPHARAELATRGLDIENFTPMTKDEMMARLD